MGQRSQVDPLVIIMTLNIGPSFNNHCTKLQITRKAVILRSDYKMRVNKRREAVIRDN